jgi:hypothetical protein
MNDIRVINVNAMNDSRVINVNAMNDIKVVKFKRAMSVLRLLGL